MADAILHIKDSYYFEVPKRLWLVENGSKSEFPDVWIRLDEEFQHWEAANLYKHYSRITETSRDGEPFELRSFGQLNKDYLAWKHDGHENAGKPFYRFLEEAEAVLDNGKPGGDKEWFAHNLQNSSAFRVRWNDAKEQSGDLRVYRETNIVWSTEKVTAYNEHLSGKILIPQPFGKLRNLHENDSGLCISRFMIIEVIIALLIWAVFSWLARKVDGGNRPRGRVWNLLESFVVFIRDEVARPAIGKHDADRFVPLLLTLFFFVLGCNLFGMLPWAGAPTGAFGATMGLAIVTFGTVFVFGMRKFGFFGFFLNQIPSMDLPLALAIFLKPMILAIELMGLAIKHLVLSIRLLANMVAGHVVLLGIMSVAFSAEGAASDYWIIAAPISVFGSVLFSCLELFVDRKSVV
jgi:F-type H+-transporting ATPase subunit a